MSRTNRKTKPTTDRARLEALRDRLAGIIDSPETSPRDVVAASREYRIVVGALGQAAAGGPSKVDEIAERRRRRAAR